MRLKDIGFINRHILPESTSPDYSFKYVDISAVNSSGRVVAPDDWTRFDSAPSRARRLAPEGSTIVSTVRTYLRAVARVPRTDENLVFSTGFAVIEPRESVDGRFLAYACQSTTFIDEVVARSVGVSYPAINPNDLGSVAVDVPSLDEQVRVADFLDAETESIDQIKRLRSRQLETLNLRRWSFFQEILNHSGSDILPLRRILHSVTDGPFGSAFSSSDYVDEGAAVVRLGNIGFNEYRAAQQARIPIAMYRDFRKHEVCEGDILIAGLGDPRNHAGRACTAPDLGPAIVKGKCFRARTDPSVTSAEFLALLLSSPLGAAALESRGSTRSMINLEIVKSAMLPIPSYDLQLFIVNEMSRFWRSALAAIEASNRQLVLLDARRQALITAAVTGQLDVTTARSLMSTGDVTA
ncbi:restriction endonuclease subunit S [Frankia tisae]|uniref:restriction endonuclease subunit S n=1 Tax=Frankia tisae TaxID=2950104 RepID=UPI0021BEDD0A|nr:restriction endonuclease subunit S [Frankia tisae]